MEYVTAVNDYVLLMPSGELRGFKDIDSARGTVYEYDLRTILENVHSGGEYEFDMYSQQNDVGIIEGVENGECQIFNLDDFISKIRESAMFQDEKDEVISKLLRENINLNVYEYGLFNLLNECEVDWA
ncbi:hypothetical protein SAMN04487886_11233 [Clostridium sp. DSM 8431]|uniref:hypothetical protein n=1 Tax=Clostridium sp. DSM 8431 TaxID=1761781 RepID=UPI0008EA0943|nr:hypothetical protein [Clostridium sp. DSM 8431]SFU73260.1 hypothetical protein SAMN04487886_11233 [Clostridium sp. DSM 8431]